MNFFQAIGEFILTDPNIRVPSRGKIYSLNEGYAKAWDPAVSEYVNSKKDPGVNTTYSYSWHATHVVRL
jgi:fructose-1,6-bisphosphatase I